MNRKILSTLLLFLLSFGLTIYSVDLANAQSPIKTLVLYDAVSGTIPDTSLLSYINVPQNSAPLTFADGATLFDTTLSGTDTYAGWISSGAMNAAFPVLDSTAGMKVRFTLQVESESHDNQNRSGFSVILLDRNAKGIELSFWENEIWVKSDANSGGLFMHGEGTAYPTAHLTEYQLMFDQTSYTLTANSQMILSGPLRDYGAFEGFPDPYETPNFIFLGDDTTSAQARVRMQFLSVTGTEPVIPTDMPTAATDTPMQLATPTALTDATPFSSPAPASPAIDFPLCPSGWLVGIGMLTIIGVKIKRRNTDQSWN